MSNKNIWFERLDVLKELSLSNPNKYTLIEKYSLLFIKDKVSEGKRYLQRIPAKIEFTEREKLIQSSWLHILSIIENIVENLSLSVLLAPINGLVLHHERQRILKQIDVCNKLILKTTNN